MATVQTLAKRYDETIQSYMAAVDKSLHPSNKEDEELVRKAVFFVRHGGVEFLTFNEERLLLEASVKDVHSVKVILNFNNLQSSCACPAEGMCKHRLAVIFALYQKIGSLSEWVADWRARKNDQLTMLPEKRSPEQWIAAIRNVWKDPIPDYTKRNFFYFEQLYEGRVQTVLSFIPLEREWKTLYRVYAQFLSMVHAWDVYADGTTEVHHSFFKRWFDDELQSLTSLLESLSGLHRTFATDPFFDELQQLVRQFIEEDGDTFSARFTVYRRFWTILFTNKRKREQEAAFFTGRDSRLQTFFALLLDKPIPPQRITPGETADWVELAVQAEENGQITALSTVLSAIRPHVKTFLFEQLYPQYRQPYVRALSQLFSRIELPETEWEDLFGQFGRYGIPAYSAYLIEKNCFRQWAELHQLHKSPLYFAEECGLKEVQTAAPDCVLPLYHRYAAEYLEDRSRNGYKQAVRMWKRMKAACKKSGQSAFFEAYIGEIRSRYKRLRALQQEIEKGNLL